MIMLTGIRRSLFVISILISAFAFAKPATKSTNKPNIKSAAKAKPAAVKPRPAPEKLADAEPDDTNSTSQGTTDDQDLVQVEKELSRDKLDDVIPAVKTAPIKAVPVVDLQGVQGANRRKTETIVLQKNYMPKTERFMVFGGLSFLPTDVFYKTAGLQARVSYHFSETWGAEITGLFLGSGRSSELTAVESQGVSVQNLVSPKSYIGLDVYINTIYGKAAFLERKIVPFEVYFSGGIGKMTTALSQGLDTLHLGVGQLFSLSRSQAFRIDLSLLSYKSLTVTNEYQLTNNLLLTVGYGHFMPEAKYR
jgi:outer membrane beta-barrel protein